MAKFEVFDLDENLPAGAHRVELRGMWLRTLHWPPFCVNCGAPTSKRMSIRKVFRRRIVSNAWTASASRYVIRRFKIPYCGACVARHEQLVEHVSPAKVLFHVVFTPLIIPFAGAAFFAIAFYHSLVTESIGTPGQTLSLVIFGALLLAMAASAFASWRSVRFNLVPRTTEITAACQISDKLGHIESGYHRAFAFRNPEYANAFASANKDRIWTQQDAKRSNRLQTVWSIATLAAVVVAWAWLHLRK